MARERGTSSAYNNFAYNRLLNTICVDFGYCGSEVDGRLRHVDDFIPAEGPVTADQFATWVFSQKVWTLCLPTYRTDVRYGERLSKQWVLRSWMRPC
jgi:hypothetical protein